MSRLPPISRKDLPDHASDERVDRIWNRVREDLPRSRRARGAASAVADLPVRSARPLMWFAAAATLFATGLAVGKFSLSDAELPITARPTGESPMTDVFAAGSHQRTFSLPGGGRLVLEPDSLVEVVELSDSVVTLSLLRGAASVDTAELPIDVVAGEARVSAPAGSSVSLARREADIDVLVAQGSVDVTSPAGHQVVKGGHALSRVPTVTKVSLDRPQQNADEPTPVAIAPRDPAQAVTSSLTEDAVTPPVAAVDPSPLMTAADASASWRSLAAAGQYKDALALLDKSGGLEAAITGSQSASELMYLSEVAGGNQKSELTVRALRRVADEFSADPSGNLAAMQLADFYEAKDKSLAAKYREKAKQSKSLAEGALCEEVRALMGDENADPRQAVQAASEYLKTYPLGFCAESARTVIDDLSGKIPPTPAGPYGDDDKKDDKDKASKDKAKDESSSDKKGSAPASSGSASAPSAPAPSSSASAKPPANSPPAGKSPANTPPAPPAPSSPKP